MEICNETCKPEYVADQFLLSLAISHASWGRWAMASGKLQAPYPYFNVFSIFHKCLQSFSLFSFPVLSYAYFPYTCSIKHSYCLTKFNWYLFDSCRLELGGVAVDYKQGIFISFSKHSILTWLVLILLCVYPM